MNEQEVINELRSLVKPYIGIIPQSTFSSILTRYDAGILKPKTLRLFFEKMGYWKSDKGWQKVKVIKSMKLTEASILPDGTFGIGATNVTYE